jgi:hypothetical protein
MDSSDHHDETPLPWTDDASDELLSQTSNTSLTSGLQIVNLFGKTSSRLHPGYSEEKMVSIRRRILRTTTKAEKGPGKRS